ncbi:hypothetical protein A9179_01105 [Pseudomonas alcaligenes]|uniref:Imelysin-like domain-containing protein n=1 Tax=Aquipseudomonas alcaligenes TaxID=43263 RepID=A0ABR7RXH4_AQUAC|nr:hypothetical protein [Pseudomonas alcaligenes]MBC9248863.1 hypothetical protein [Pseudomonas alcaligenes]
MRRFPLSLAGLWLALFILQPAQAEAQLELLQLSACRTTNSFMLLRGEGLQPEHQQRYDGDRAALQAAFAQLAPDNQQALQQPYQQLLASLAEGQTFGPREDDLPWQYPGQLSRALVGLLEAAEARDGQTPETPLGTALKLEYLATQYVGQAYLGYFEITPSPDAHYVNQSGEQLLASLDNEMGQAMPLLEQQIPGQERRVQADWRYLRAALGDFDNAGRARLGRSGKPLVPLVISRHARSLSERLAALPGGQACSGVSSRCTLTVAPMDSRPGYSVASAAEPRVQGDGHEHGRLSRPPAAL